jgi:hypothetical protein
MPSRSKEPIFALILILASGIALSSYMLGVVLDPLPAIVLSGVLVVIGVAVAVPEGDRAIGSIIALLAVGVAGVGVPRLVAESVTPRDEMGMTLALSGIVLLLTIVALRLTVFSPKSRHPASQ